MQERPDLYGPVHKGLRNALNATLLKLGQLDPADPADVTEALLQLRDVLAWCEKHIDIEEQFIHTAVERRRPAALVGRLRGDHGSHERDFSLLRDDAEALERSLADVPAVAKARARQLYLSYSRFVAENLAHMAVEETEMTALLAELFTPAEIGAIFVSILASEPPEQLMRGVRWVMPAVDPTERAEMARMAQAGVDPATFSQLLAALKTTLSPRDHDKLLHALGMEAAA
jgi:Hemerythrin HHE cation binding domain